MRAGILIGSSEGDKLQALTTARNLLTGLGTISKSSSVYRSEPWGFTHSEWFLNQLVEIESSLDPDELMETLLSIEAGMGRVRQSGESYQSRVIDLDIIYIDEIVHVSEILTVPHPKLHERRFVLVPLHEMVPAWQHPVLRLTPSELLIICKDTLIVEKC